MPRDDAWSDRAIRYLRKAWAAGDKTVDIGLALGYSKGAVIGKAHRLELPMRESPIWRGPRSVPDDEPAPNHEDWPESKVRDLRKAWAAGDTATMIGRQLGVSRDAVIGKAHRLGLEKRPNAGPRPNVPTVRRPPQIKRPVAEGSPKPDRIERVGPVSLPALASIAVLQAPMPMMAEPPPPAPVVRRLNAMGCCWLYGSRPFRSCDAPRFGRLPYCEEHADIAYRSKAWKHGADEQAQATGDD